VQALDNLEKEMQKAFAKMEKDLENHAAIFKRLEGDLKAVKGFEYTEALEAMRQHDSALYAAIRDAYEQEHFKTNGDAMNKHCQGVIAAVNAIYNLGYSNGFKQGAEYAQKG
jgi:Skp family chaperone for outer membrane proteins